MVFQVMQSAKGGCALVTAPSSRDVRLLDW